MMFTTMAKIASEFDLFSPIQSKSKYFTFCVEMAKYRVIAKSRLSWKIALSADFQLTVGQLSVACQSTKHHYLTL